MWLSGSREYHNPLSNQQLGFRIHINPILSGEILSSQKQGFFFYFPQKNQSFAACCYVFSLLKYFQTNKSSHSCGGKRGPTDLQIDVSTPLTVSVWVLAFS